MESELAYDSDRIEYHKDTTRVSSSGMKTFLNKGWDAYRDDYLEGKKPFKRTKPMVVGSILNDLLLMGWDWCFDRYVVVGDHRGKRPFKEGRKAWLSQGKDEDLCVTIPEWNEAQASLGVCEKNDFLMDMLRDCDPEVGVKFSVGPLRAKSLMDGVSLYRSPMPLYLELKRTNLRVSFRETARRFDYPAQAAWNSLAIHAITGRMPEVVWAVVYEDKKTELITPDAGEVWDRILKIQDAAPEMARLIAEWRQENG